MESRLRSCAYPIIDLEAAQRLLVERLEEMGSRSLSRAAMAERLGYSRGEGGVAGRKLGALVQYGLLERRAGKYSLSSLGLRLQALGPKKKEHIQTLRTTLQKPPIFRGILRYIGSIGQAPDDLAPILVENFGITEKASGEAAGVFMRSARFAEVLDPWGKLIFEELRLAHPSSQNSRQVLNSIERGSSGQVARHEEHRWLDYFQLPSRKEAAVDLPPLQEMTPKDCEMLRLGVETWLPSFRRFLDGPAGSKGDLVTPPAKDLRWRKQFLLSAQKTAFIDLPAVDRLTVGDHEEIERHLLVWISSLEQHLSQPAGLRTAIPGTAQQANVRPFRGLKRSASD